MNPTHATCRTTPRIPTRAANSLPKRNAPSSRPGLPMWPLLFLLVWTGVAAEPRRGGTLRLAIASDIRTLDPAGIYNWLEGSLGLMIHAPLLDYDAGENLIPRLAESLPTISPDRLTYTLRLREGARFSNGRTVTAEDAAFSFERHLDPRYGSSYGPFYQNIAGSEAFTHARSNELASATGRLPGTPARWLEPVRLPGLRVLDHRTLEIRLKKPDFIFADILAIPNSAIVPREESERLGPAFGTRPTGAGPFQLTRWVRGVSIRLDRNPAYHLDGEPHLDAVDVWIGLDGTTEMMMFERGELDYVNQIGPAHLARVRRDPNLRRAILRREGTTPTYVALNCEMPPLNDVRVRQAMNLAVNKQRLLQVLKDRGVEARGVLPPSIRGFNPNLAGYPHNPAKARALLAEAGHAAGFQLPFWVADDAVWRTIALVIQQDLKEVGIDAQIQAVNGTIMVAAQQRGRVPMSIWDWLANFNDPKDTLDTLLNGDRITATDCLNVAFYSNPRVNELFQRADAESDPARRLGLYREAEERVVADAPWIFLLNLNKDALCQPRLHGVRSRAVWPNRFEHAWFAE